MSRSLFAKKPLAMLLEEMKGESRLRRILGPVQLTSLGVGAIIGTGIFVLTGVAAHNKTGPALMLSFVVSGLACIFAALCYAEFASMVPVAGSAYTYAYATLGEMMAWIVGWDLVLEYAVASATVAHGWSHYFQDFIQLFGLTMFMPGHSMEKYSNSPIDYDAATGHIVRTLTANGSSVLFDLPALAIAIFITIVLVKGIRESATFNAAMVGVKVAIVFFVIVVGAMYVDPRNWHPFAPFGYGGITFFGKTIWGQVDKGGEPVGMMAGAAVIFFAYIGFDAVSTHAEEAKNPKRDVPIGIIASLFLCTFLYITVAAILTGMIPSGQINIDAPVSSAFAQVGLPWARYLISFGALTGITSVLLVMMLSQPRILLAMARDGLLPHSFFGAVHEKFRTPWKSTLLTGAFVSVLASFLPLSILADLVNIGTLFAFVIVCSAVLIMRRTNPEAERPYRAPFGAAVPILGIAICLLLMFSLPVANWYRLVGWLAIGLMIYFGYGRSHSVMAKYEAKARR